MKRDMELVKEILLSIEEHDKFNDIITLDIKGYTKEVLNYHVKILSEAGLITASSYAANTQWKPIDLTWEGHEFLDAIKNDTVWSKLKEKVKEKGSDIPFSILKDLAMQLTRAVFFE